VNQTLALGSLTEILALIDSWGKLYDARWGKHSPYIEDLSLDQELQRLIDPIRARVKFAHDVVVAMGEAGLAGRIVEFEEGQFGRHPFSAARVAVVEAIAILSQQEELALITGPIGPRLAASELQEKIWSAASSLWDGGQFGFAVQAASSALESKLQRVAGGGVSGESLAGLFSLADPVEAFPRLRFRFLDPASKTWKSAHDGAGALVRGAFMGIRNLVSHSGWPEPTASEALEMLAVLSYVARLSERAEIETVK